MESVVDDFCQNIKSYSFDNCNQINLNQIYRNAIPFILFKLIVQLPNTFKCFNLNISVPMCRGGVPKGS